MLFLHLTDLHLADKASYDDMKGPVELPADSNNILMLENTLTALSNHLDETGKKLTGIIISGDITTANSESGYQAFSTILDKLGKHRPANNKIMVVPGNHDVTWRTKQSSKEKYKHFLSYINNEGYCIPYLDCLTNNSKGKAFINFDDQRVQFVLINSSNYCGLDIFENLDDANVEGLFKLAVGVIPEAAEIVKAIKKVRIHDIARISKEQFTWLQKNLREDKKRKDYLKIAILHHHISAVSPEEEFKSTENITNTGLLYNILRNFGFSIVLHGHKHKGLIYNVAIPDYSKHHNAIVDHHNISVVSGSAITKGNKADIGRLLEFEKISDKLTVNCQSFEAVESGGTKLNFNTRVQIYPITPKFDVDSSSVTTVISGKTIDDTYEKILSHFDNMEEDADAFQIVTEIQTNDPNIPYAIPREYKFPGNREVTEEWLKEIVEWWKRPVTTLNVPFTHGQRIHRFGNGIPPIDQLKDIKDFLAKKLQNKPIGSSARAFINLHDPIIDHLTDERVKSPQLSCIQFTLTKDGSKTKLNAIAYFRKQELRYWWVVNIAEIKSMLIDISKEFSSSKVEIGSITTFAGMAYATKQNASPEVAVPKLDILYDDYKLDIREPNQFWGLAYSLVNISMPGRDAFKDLWKDVLTDLQPREAHDENTIPVSIEGLQNIAREIARYIDQGAQASLKNIHNDLLELLETNIAFKELLDNNGVHAIEEKYKAWRESCLEKTKKILTKINRLYETNKPKIKTNNKKSISTKKQPVETTKSTKKTNSREGAPAKKSIDKKFKR